MGPKVCFRSGALISANILFKYEVFDHYANIFGEQSKVKPYVIGEISAVPALFRIFMNTDNKVGHGCSFL